MPLQSELTLAILGLLAAIFAFTAYRWYCRRRSARITIWIKKFLSNRYGELPKELQIYCTDDERWPVLVAFDNPHPGNRRRLQFICSGAQSNYRLQSENVDECLPIVNALPKVV